MIHILKIPKNAINENFMGRAGGKHCSNSITILNPVKRSITLNTVNILNKRKAEKKLNTRSFHLYLLSVFLTECKASPMIA